MIRESMASMKDPLSSRLVQILGQKFFCTSSSPSASVDLPSLPTLAKRFQVCPSAQFL
jgi:hypothetical protein